ncbi:MAG: MFS transporter [Bdellovibrionaceae bacterium]|nr:MFS transporter [Pseudobdellovibrionaceae bacterium]|tara:strand:+ start:4390 stop:5616 length:1227 start_codon:yes stop_codon:yes gene_type:complete
MEKKASKKALGIIFLIVFMDLVGFGMIIPLSTYLAKDLGASPLEIGLLMTIYSLMQFIFSPFWGKLSDRVGRRPILLLSLFGSSLSFLFYAYSTELWMLYASRALAGIFGANISTAMAYIADVTDKDSRSKGMGLIGAAFGMGFVFGPFIGGIFGDIGRSLGTEAPFGLNFSALIASGICFLNFFCAIKILKESLTPEMRQNLPKRSSRVKQISRFVTKPLLGSLLFTTLLSTVAMAHMESTMFLFVKEQFDWSLSFASYGFAYIGLMMVFTQGYLIRKWMPKYGERKLLVIGLIMSVIGMAGISFTTGVWSMLVVQTILALGYGLLNPSLLGSISLSGEANEQGQLMGVNQSMSALGRIIGPAAGGFVYQAIGKTSPYIVAASLFFLALIFIAKNYSKLPNQGLSRK